MPTRPKRKRNARKRRDAEIIALTDALIEALRELNATVARLETMIARSTERFAAMRCG